MSRGAYKKRVFDKEHAMDLYRKGLSDKEIAEEMGSFVTTVGDWRRSEGLSPNKPRPAVNERSQLSREAYEARKAGMNYGMYKAQQFEAQKRAKAQVIPLGVRR